jgi:16S rRNA (uracil1498-N3)-methyltransferase
VSAPRAHVDGAVLDGIADGRATLPPDAAHRFTRVLRLKDGDAIELFDGGRRVARGTLALPDAIKDVVVSEVEDALPPLVIAQAVTKTDKLELVVKKGTELGASCFILVDTARGQVHLGGERADKRVDRLLRVAEDAARQSGRASVPSIEGPLAIRDLAARIRSFTGVSVVGVVGAAGPLSAALAAAADKLRADGVLVVVGPEGGLDPAEIDALVDAGAVPVRLGVHVLRTETAALAALAAAQAALGTL